MKRLLVAAALCAAILLPAAPVAPAAGAPLPAAGHSGASARAPVRPRDRMGRAPRKFEPLARRILTGSGDHQGHVYDYSGRPAEVGAAVRWWVVDRNRATAPATATRTPTATSS